MQNKEYTFWNLLEEYSIEVPIIQRDYVQGRKKEERVRKKFLNAIYDSLINNKKLHLDFIYGVLKNDKFIPLDGQQRLTTLFLLHYYLALKENKFEEFKNHLKKEENIKFSYEIRESSREFCEKLINNKIELNDNISKVIEDENWFFSKWKQDPTISSMLIMLDEIQNIFKENNLFEKLKNNITFSFLEPKKFNIKNENELYIKMNSRGKPLNEFENFKAYFTSFLDNANKTKFDNEWFDIFWNLKKNQLENESNEKKAEEIIENEIFNAYLNFFKNITAFYSDKFNEVDVFKFDYANYIDEITKTLDCLISFDDSIIYDLRPYKDFKINIFEDFIAIDSSKPEYEKRLRFYALMKFFIKIGEINKCNESLLKQWMRVSLNLINNTLYNKIDDFYRVKNLLDNLINLLDNNFYNNLSTSNLSSTQQFKEEKLKAKLIIDFSAENEFIEAEKNWYLDGQIGFLIEFAGGENNFNLNEFKEYRDKFIELWNFAKENQNIKNQEEKKNEHLIQRALLTIDTNKKIEDNENSLLCYLELTKHKKNRYTFCSFGTSLREKNENWRRVFDSDYFKKLLNKINLKNNIFNILKELIDEYEFDCKNWKSYFINPKKDWTPIFYARNYQIEWNSENEIFLNRGYWDGVSAVNSWNWSKKAELYSYYLFKILKERKIYVNPFKNVNYYNSSEDYPCVVINNWKYKSNNFAIDIKYKKLNNQQYGFSIEFFNRNKKNFPIEIETILKNNGFNLINERYINTKFLLCELFEGNYKLIQFIENLLKQLENDIT